jgi:hypothetical protein
MDHTPQAATQALHLYKGLVFSGPARRCRTFHNDKTTLHLVPEQCLDVRLAV